MNLFLLLLALLLLILPVLGGAFFLFLRSVRRALALVFPAGRRLCIWLAAAATALAAGAFVLFWRVFPVWLLYFAAAAALIEALGLAVRRVLRGREPARGRRILAVLRRTGAAAAALSTAAVCLGAWNMSTVVRTDYTVVSDKLDRDYTVVFLSDTHYDTIQNKALVAEKAAEISALSPDLVLLVGDIVEEGTSAESMREIFAVLGGIESRLGTFFVYGNHDRQFYSSSPAFTPEELARTIGEAGITVLLDEVWDSGEGLVLVGRDDREQARVPAAELTAGVPEDRFVLIADHQPYTAEEDAAASDLIVSGHTHAGQIFPAGVFIELFNRYNYGRYDVNGTPLIVSSGFTGWGFPLRTQARCEYVVVRLTAG